MRDVDVEEDARGAGLITKALDVGKPKTENWWERAGRLRGRVVLFSDGEVVEGKLVRSTVTVGRVNLRDQHLQFDSDDE
jgi:hypothetical protein